MLCIAVVGQILCVTRVKGVIVNLESRPHSTSLRATMRHFAFFLNNDMLQFIQEKLFKLAFSNIPFLQNT